MQCPHFHKKESPVRTLVLLFDKDNVPENMSHSNDRCTGDVNNRHVNSASPRRFVTNAPDPAKPCEGHKEGNEGQSM